ncbi:MAG: group II intron reverse transcriptase domain-containing protein [Bacteroidetes bacterium]|nr:group II intron reverse transcriptase domain-containing protein [Bacteroidota bacterium]
MFTEELWQEWVEQESSNYKTEKGKKVYLKKGYVHFDHRFWFPDRNSELKKVLQANLKIFNSKLQRSEYWAFSPFLKILIKTPRYRYQELDNLHDLETKIRPICFASHFDSLIFSFYSFCLTKLYEKYIVAKKFSECVLAYRSDLGKCNIQFAKEVFQQVQSRGECTAIALDIKGCFDNIDHVTLKEKWKAILGSDLPEDQFRIFKNLTKYSYVSKNGLLKKFTGPKKRNEKLPATLLDTLPGTKDFEKYQALRDSKLIVTNDKPDSKSKRFKGIPQGSALSALLSNIYLIDYDKEMYEKSQRENFIYRRYCDDILIICDTAKATELKYFAIQKISKDYFLTIQDKKVETIDFKLNSKKVIRAFKRNKTNLSIPAKINLTNEKTFYKPLQYLGFEFNGQNILVRSSSLSKYFRKMRSRIIKTISMAYGATAKSDKVFLKQLFEKYSHLGERNFITYAYNASNEFYSNGSGKVQEGMKSPSIKKQLSRHFNVMKNTLESKNEQRINYKATTNKPRQRKQIG